MHSFESHNVNFNFNGDFSGDLSIRIHAGTVDSVCLEIPCEAVLELVAYYVMGERISKLEQEDYREILGI